MGETTERTSLCAAARSACTNGPDEYGNWPCDPEDNGDGTATCAACGWMGGYAKSSRVLIPRERRRRLMVARLKTLIRRAFGHCPCGQKAAAWGWCDDCLEYPEGS